jgi:hypothetical protein
MLRELVPAAKLIAVLLNPGNPQAEIQTDELVAAGRTAGQESFCSRPATIRKSKPSSQLSPIAAPAQS